MRNFINGFLKNIRLLRTLHIKQFLHYHFGTNQILKLTIQGKEIWIRKGTPDLKVALVSLNGEFNMLKHLFPKDYKGIIVDAGGYIGTAAIAFSEMYPHATILSIEASAENFKILQKNIIKYPNIKAIFGALIATDEKHVSLYNRKTGEWGYTVIEDPKDQPNAEKIEEIPGVRLSGLGIAIENIGILKLDIEGGEHALLTKETEILNIIPAIIIELHDRIIDGCSDSFFLFSKNRIVLKDKGEKYISLKTR